VNKLLHELDNGLYEKGIEVELMNTIKKSATPLKIHISNNRAKVIANVIMKDWKLQPKGK
jgi:hypothetical protein